MCITIDQLLNLHPRRHHQTLCPMSIETTKQHPVLKLRGCGLLPPSFQEPPCPPPHHTCSRRCMTEQQGQQTGQGTNTGLGARGSGLGSWVYTMIRARPLIFWSLWCLSCTLGMVTVTPHPLLRAAGKIKANFAANFIDRGRASIN